MIQDILPRVFDNQYKNCEPSGQDVALVFQGHGKSDDKVLISIRDGKVMLPNIADCRHNVSDFRYLFSIDETKYFLYVSKDMHEADVEIAGFSFELVRELRRNNPVHICFAGMTAYHLYMWYRDSLYCGHCGTATVHDDKLRMVRCPKCGTMKFPMIAPAVIVGLIHEDSILISTYAGREYKGRALLAGFCEIGETPEETVKREVFEEVGLKVKDITYFASQPWGFDSNLLLGYFCHVDGSTNITRDESELATAKFVKRQDIEIDENLLSLTATMIEKFRTGEIV